MRDKFGVWLGLAIILSLSLPLIAQEPTNFEWADCPRPIPYSVQVDCGYLSVPENRSDPNSATIRLAVAIIRTTHPTPEPDPVIYLDGGPGGEAIYYLEEWVDFPTLANRDLIILDQRGMGFSEPRLECEIELTYGDTGHLDEDVLVTETTQCRDRFLNDGIDLAGYTTLENAADLRDLRIALELESWNLFGISYGTRLALVTLREHPEGIRSLILDGVAPAELHIGTLNYVNADDAIDNLFEACASDPSCNANFPDIRTRFYDMIASLNKNPVEMEFGDLLTGRGVVSGVFNALYQVDYMRGLPVVLSALIDGDPEPYVELVWYENLAILETEETYPTGLTWDAFGDELSVSEFDAITTETRDELAERIAALDLETIEFLVQGLRFDNAESLAAAVYGFTGDEFWLLYDNVDYYFYFGIEEDQALMEELNFDYIPDLADYRASLSDDEYQLLLDEIGFDFNILWWEDYDGFSDGAFIAIRCSDGYDSAEYLQTIIAITEDDMPDSMMTIQTNDARLDYRECDLWDSGAENTPLIPAQSNIPILLLSGQFDPITLPRYADATQQYLPNSYHYVIPAVGHRVTHLECPQDMLSAFVNDPSVEPDSTCIADIPNIQFVTEINRDAFGLGLDSLSWFD